MAILAWPHMDKKKFDGFVTVSCVVTCALSIGFPSLLIVQDNECVMCSQQLENCTGQFGLIWSYWIDF